MRHRSEKHLLSGPMRGGPDMFLLRRLLEAKIRTKMMTAVDRSELAGPAVLPLHRCRAIVRRQHGIKNLSPYKIVVFHCQLTIRPVSQCRQHRTPPARAICVNAADKRPGFGLLPRSQTGTRRSRLRPPDPRRVLRLPRRVDRVLKLRAT